MIIRVTQEHIDKGVKGNCSACPVAIAITEAIGINSAVYFGGHNLVIDNISKITIAPASVVAFVIRFDRKEAVEPFEFKLEGF